MSSLTMIHIFLIISAVALIGGVLADYFLDERSYKQYIRSRNIPNNMSARPMIPRSTRFTPNYRLPNRYPSNKVTMICIIVLSYILPVLVTDYSIPITYAISGHLGIAGICKAVIAFIFAIALICVSNYVRHRGYRINSIILDVYSALMFIYGIYISYNVIVAYYDLYELHHMF